MSTDGKDAKNFTTEAYSKELQVFNPEFDMKTVNNKGVERNKVIEKKSIVAIGIPDALCNSKLLARPEFFGQYGKIA